MMDWLSRCLSINDDDDMSHRKSLLYRLLIRHKTLYDLFLNHTHVFKFDFAKDMLFSMEVIPDFLKFLQKHPENSNNPYYMDILKDIIADMMKSMTETYPREYIKYRISKSS